MTDEERASYAVALRELEEAEANVKAVREAWNEYRSEEKLRDREVFREDVLLAWFLQDAKGSVWNASWKKDDEKKTIREWAHELAKEDKRFADYAWVLGEKALADDLKLRNEINEKLRNEINEKKNQEKTDEMNWGLR